MLSAPPWDFSSADEPWGEDVYRWGARDNGDPADTDSPFVSIPVGALDAEGTATVRLWKQFETATVWHDLAELIGELFDEADDTLADVGFRRYRFNAQGVQLDEIGALVGRARGSLVDDDDYRRAILVDAATLFASGTPDEIIDLATALTEGTAIFHEFYPATFVLRVPDVSTADFNLLVDILSDVPPAGVASLLATHRAGQHGTFGSIYGDVASPAGFGSIHGDVENRNPLGSARGF